MTPSNAFDIAKNSKCQDSLEGESMMQTACLSFLHILSDTVKISRS